MKRKNLVAMGLAGVMAVGMCMPVMAAAGDNTWTQDGEPASTDTTVEYTVADKYTVTIPSTITFTADGDNKFNVSVGEKSAINEAEMLTVKVASGEITLKTGDNGNGKGSYKVELSNTSGVLTGASPIVAQFAGMETAQTAEVTLNGKADASNTPNIAGTYKGDIVFTVALEAPAK